MAERDDMRPPLARAAAPGSAGNGVAHWWAQRLTAVALAPLTLWFAAEIVAHTGSDYTGFLAWMRSLPTEILMILLLVALFRHAALGLETIVGDYIHSGARFAALACVRLLCFAFAAAGIVAVLRIAVSP